MPKGGDLHNHLSGAVYAESYIRWAADAGMCVDQQTLTLTTAPCNAAQGHQPVSQAFTDVVLYRRMVDAWSMRNWELSGQSGHDHFFDAFGKFGPAAGMWGEMLAEVAGRAARERVGYLELMLTPDGVRSRSVGSRVGWDDDFGEMRDKLLANGLREAVADGRKALDDAEANERQLLKCGTPQADAGCGVTVRYLYQVSRGAQREQVFAQILAGFEMASADARVVGLNLVQPEDWYVPMRDFSLHMRMLNYLHRLYPRVHIALHAGELAHGLVPPEGLWFHIRESIYLGHAERIGHGVSIMEEDDPAGLLREMSARKVLVEICLTSNALILGISGSRHPLFVYLKYGVPVALATDDEGVSRSDMTHEYLRAAEDQGLDYIRLKTMARASIEHAFIGGESLWRDVKNFISVPQCAMKPPRMSSGCRRFLDDNAKARLQWALEGAFVEFEAKY
jgi:hypothetical protein